MTHDLDRPARERTPHAGSVRRLPVSYKPVPSPILPEEGRDPLREPLFQANLAVLLGVLCTAGGLVARQYGLIALATVALTLAAGGFVVFTLVLAQSASRKKLIDFWRDRRDLRVTVRELTAERRLLLSTMERLRTWESGPHPEAQPALAELVDGAQAALAAYHADVAVLLVTECTERWTISHSAFKGGSRWCYLRTDKWCPMEGQTAEERLRALASHHHAFPVEIPGGRLLLAVLYEDPVDERLRSGDDDPETARRYGELMDGLELSFELLAAHWHRRAPVEAHPLRGAG